MYNLIILLLIFLLNEVPLYFGYFTLHIQILICRLVNIRGNYICTHYHLKCPQAMLDLPLLLVNHQLMELQDYLRRPLLVFLYLLLFFKLTVVRQKELFVARKYKNYSTATVNPVYVRNQEL
uniref:Uncharacterized protein n=1 Tax=Theileria annulata TaxID=5874 RepID=A0A3B0NKT2_THEAN